MGQRHQAFLVANVVPSAGKAARYQCIAALHHQWCYGSLPLRAALRFITLLKQPANMRIIREELRAIGSASANVEKERRHVPCPFTQFLFISAFGVSLDDPANAYSSRASNLEATMGAWAGDNNDGLTIIDVTDPENATCCLIAGGSYPDLNPITAEQYISIYYEDRHEREAFEALIRSFDAIPVLSKSVLNESWENRRERKRFQAFSRFLDSIPGLSKSVINEAWRRTDADTAFSTTSQLAMPVVLKQEVPSLVRLTLKTAVEQAIAQNNIDVLDFTFVDPTKVAVIKEVIRSYNPVSDAAFALLRKLVAVEKSETLDFSGYSLTRKQMIDILALFSGSEVNLSHDPDLKIDDLEEILQKTPHTVRRLLLFDTGITNSEIILLLDTKPKLFYHLESIVHPAFLSGFYENEPVKPSPVFTHVMFAMFAIGGLYAPWGVSLPYFTPNTLAQGLTDYLSPITAARMSFAYDMSISLAAMAAYAACSRTDSQPWGERTVAYVPRSKTSNLMSLDKGEWLLLVAYDHMPCCMKAKCLYAIMRANKAGEDFLSSADSPESKAKLTVDVLFKPELLDVFDIRGFFTELEREGRPAPEPKVLEKLLGLFPVDGDNIFTFLGYEALMQKVKFK